MGLFSKKDNTSGDVVINTSGEQSNRKIVYNYYKYSGTNLVKNKKVKGVKSAVDAEDALNKLKLMGIEVESLELKPDPYNLNKFLYTEVSVQGKPKKKDIASFLDNLSFLLLSGMSNISALEHIMISDQNMKVRVQAHKISESLKLGYDLATAMKMTNFYTLSMVSQVDAGLAGGELPNALSNIVKEIKKDLELKAKVVTALVYPGFILIMLVCMLWGMMLFVIPNISKALNSLGGELPSLTKKVIAASEFFQQYSLHLFIGIIAVFFVAYLMYSKIEKVRYVVDWGVLRLPLLGGILLKTNLSRFCRSYASLQRCNIPTVRSLTISGSGLSNLYLQKGVFDSRDAISANGFSLLDAMRQTQKFPYTMLAMIGVGTASGSLVEVCDKIADRYEEEVDRLVKRATSLMEPIMILLIGVVVGTVVIAMYLPMFSMVDYI